MLRFVNVGFGNIINKDRIVGVLSPSLSSTKQLVSKSREEERLLDVTTNRKIKSVLVTDCGYVYLCALSTDTIMGRLNDENDGKED